jgi:hypothetical protein
VRSARRLTTRLLALLAPLWIAIGLASPVALAGDALHHAGLVVRDPAGRMTYAWIPFREEEITGIDLLKRSGLPVVSVGFGALGEGVCAIGGEGCGIAECRRTVCQAAGADAPYWQYFRQDRDDPAIWQWLPLGASATRVHDGDVFGWSWTGDEPGLPALPAAEVAALAGAGEGQGDRPAVRTLLPEGVAARAPHAPPSSGTTIAAAGILTAIGGAAIGLAIWRRTPAVAG